MLNLGLGNLVGVYSTSYLVQLMDYQCKHLNNVSDREKIMKVFERFAVIIQSLYEFAHVEGMTFSYIDRESPWSETPYYQLGWTNKKGHLCFAYLNILDENKLHLMATHWAPDGMVRREGWEINEDLSSEDMQKMLRQMKEWSDN
jgi:hypothetical protein